MAEALELLCAEGAGRFRTQNLHDVVLEKYHALWGVAAHPKRNPAPQPVSLERRDIDQLCAQEYMVADKSDGERHLLFLTSFEDLHISMLIDRRLNVQPVAVAAKKSYFKGSIFDGELVKEGEGACLLIFDVVAIAGDRSVAEQPFTRRNERIRDIFDLTGLDIGAADKVQQFARTHKKVICGGGPDHFCASFRPKACFHISMFDTLLRSIPQLPYACDGVIFTPVHEPVRTGTHPRMFKLKLRHSVDLELRVPSREALVGVAGGPETANLRVDVGEAAPQLRLCSSFWEQVLLARAPASCIAEVDLRRDDDAVLGVFSKLRRDKEHPNTDRTVQRTVVNLFEDIDFQEVLRRVAPQRGQQRVELNAQLNSQLKAQQ